MANSLNNLLRKSTYLKKILWKNYATFANTCAKENQQNAQKTLFQKEPLRINKLENGIICTSMENFSPITRLAAVFNVGSRDESHDELGSVHALRVFAPLSTRNYSLFGLSRNLDQMGAQMSVTSTRETITYLLECCRPNFSRAVDIFSEIISRPEYKLWEIENARKRLIFDIECYNEMPQIRISDLIHRASFVSGLSNSLYAPVFNAEKIDGNMLTEFRSKNFTYNRLSLIGIGLKHDDLLRNADLIRIKSNPAISSRQTTKFISSEIREDNDSEFVHLAIGFEGVSLSSKEQLASGVLCQSFGVNANRIKYSSGFSKLAKIISLQAKNSAAASCFNLNYTDTGLFGFHIIADKNDIGKVVKNIHAEFQKSAKDGLSNDDLIRAKNSLKADTSYKWESMENLIDSLSLNSEQANYISNMPEYYKAVDLVSLNDVNSLLKRMANSKPSLAAIGNLSNLPRLDELRE